MPLAAALAVIAMLGGVLAVSTDRKEDISSQSRPTGAAADQAPRLRPDASVCQSILNRPGPDDPQTFPAMYTQRREARGLTIVADSRVSDEALDIAVRTVEEVFANNNLEEPLAAERAYVVVADDSQGVLDLPEFGCLEEELGAQFFSHVCGVADRADYPVATVNELDLVGDRSGPCGGLNILYHELGHLVQGWTLNYADYLEVKYLYQAALDAGKYRGEYASTNPNEYFAEGTQAFFSTQVRGEDRDREWLKQSDPDLYQLLDRIYNE